MESRKLTPEQIDELFVFCRKHYVYHYDLQIELIDHLASVIESRWENEPDISFQRALNQTFREFGIYGFGKIKSAKEKALRKKYNRMLWQFMGGYFKLPKVIMTLAFTLTLFLLLQMVENDGIIIGAYILLFLPFGIAYHFYFFPKYFKINLIAGKSFLLNDYLKTVQGSLFFLLLFPFQSFNYFQIFSKYSVNTWIEFLIALFISTFTIMIYASCFYIPKKIREHFTEQFPQFISS